MPKCMTAQRLTDSHSDGSVPPKLTTTKLMPTNARSIISVVGLAVPPTHRAHGVCVGGGIMIGADGHGHHRHILCGTINTNLNTMQFFTEWAIKCGKL